MAQKQQKLLPVRVSLDSSIQALGKHEDTDIDALFRNGWKIAHMVAPGTEGVVLLLLEVELVQGYSGERPW